VSIDQGQQSHVERGVNLAISEKRLCQGIFLADSRQVEESFIVQEGCWELEEFRLAFDPAGDINHSTESSNECCISGIDVKVL
jgi:hypothetical protein